MPFTISSNKTEALWSKMVESARKAVERVFGILQKRFQICKFQHLHFSTDQDKHNNMIRTIAGLHNFLHESDGMSDYWGEAENWDNDVAEGFHDLEVDNLDLLNPNDDSGAVEDDDPIHGDFEVESVIDAADINIGPEMEYMVNAAPEYIKVLDKFAYDAHSTRRNMMVRHFNIVHQNKSIRWKRRMEADNPKLNPSKRLRVFD